MASRVYVLKIADSVAGPALELMRRVCQPTSRSMPHITVRHASNVLPDGGSLLYDDFSADHIYLSAPGSFDPLASSGKQLSTLFIRCESEQLESLSYRPDFPDGVFHATLYDGRPSSLAAELFAVVRSFPWGLDVPLPNSRVEAHEKSVVPSGAQGPYLSPLAADLLSRVTNSSIDAADLLDLPDKSRIQVVAAVCDALHSSLRTGVGAGVPPQVRRFDGRPTVEQGEFWSVLELMQSSGAGKNTPFNRDHQRRIGLFLTPPELASDVVRAALEFVEPTAEVRFGDPAIGSGIFVASLIKHLGKRHLSSAQGIEADAGRASLTADRWRRIGLEIATGDFVDRSLLGASDPDDSGRMKSDADFGGVARPWFATQPNLLIANPPYVRFQKLDPTVARLWRTALVKQLEILVDPRSDLYIYFVLAAHEWLDDEGIAAWLLPTEFMFTNYGASLREYLTTHVQLLRVHAFDGPSKFSNARITSCVVVFRKRPPLDSDTVEISSGGPATAPDKIRSIGVGLLRMNRKWRYLSDFSIPEPELPSQIVVEDLFQVRRGIATGANDMFVISSQMVEALEIPRVWVKPVLPKARLLPSPIIDRADDGSPALKNFDWLIDADVTLSAIKETSQPLAEYLESIQAAAMQRTLVRRRKPFYKQEQQVSPRFVFSYMARAAAVQNRFYLNRSDAVALNNFLCLVPRQSTQDWLDADEENEGTLLRILQAIDGDQILLHGRTYVEGLTKIEPGELREVKLTGVPDDLREAAIRSRRKD